METIKQWVENEVDSVLQQKKEYYLYSDFNIGPQMIDFWCQTYEGKVMTKYLKSLGYKLTPARIYPCSEHGNKTIIHL